MHTQVLDDSRPVVMVMKTLGLGSVYIGAECDALGLVCALAGPETPSSARPPIGTCQTAPAKLLQLLRYLRTVLLDTACM